MTKQRLELTWYNKDMALIPTAVGKYGYMWVDPADPRYCETRTLVMDDYVRGDQSPKSDAFAYSERADLPPQEDNLLILGESGDVLEALTRVPELADKYNGNVKLVYIDPPFNTSQTFESYEDNLEHSIWLTMMRDRLQHLKRLLSNDGSIWVHLDDVEVHRMRLLLDEVFGASNFVGEIGWEKVYSPRGDARGFSKRIDYIIVYRKADAFSPRVLDVPADLTQFRFMDEQGKRYRSDPLRKWGKNSLRADRPNLWYPITAPNGEKVWPIKPDGTEGNWRWQQTTVEQRYNELDWLDKGNGLQPYVRQYADDSDTRPPETLWLSDSAGHSQEAKEEIKKLFPGKIPFSTPKPERLLERIIHIGTDPGDIVLDCFAGSGTTAAVAQKMGRRWVTCELLESTFNTFIRPRLEMVVRDQDSGGITRTEGERIAAASVDLPDSISADDAAAFNSVLNKLIKDNDYLDEKLDELTRKCPRKGESAFTEKDFTAAVKLLKSASKTTKSKEVINWRGGGGFQVAHLSPACFDYDPKLDRVMLAADATDELLKRSVAANLGFRLLDPDDETDEDTFAALCFHGRRGNSFLYVYNGAASMGLVDWLVQRIRPGQTIVLAVTSVADGIREHLRKSCKGSRVVVIPDDIFRYSKGGDE